MCQGRRFPTTPLCPSAADGDPPPFSIMALTQPERKQESPEPGCLAVQRLLARGQAQGGCSGGCCVRSRLFPSLSGKGGHGGAGGDAGEDAGDDAGLHQSPVSNQLIFSPNPHLLTSFPGSEPTWLNCAHLAHESGTARSLEIQLRARGPQVFPQKPPPVFQARGAPGPL